MPQGACHTLTCLKILFTLQAVHRPPQEGPHLPGDSSPPPWEPSLGASWAASSPHPAQSFLGPGFPPRSAQEAHSSPLCRGLCSLSVRVPHWPRGAGGLARQVLSDSCGPTDCSLPGSSVPRSLQARVLEWVAIAVSSTSYASDALTLGPC